MKRMKNNRILAVLLAVLLLLPLACRALPSAYAVTQSDIDRVQEEKENLSQKQEQAQSKIDQLREQKASVMEQKEALDERNAIALEQLELIREQIDLYTEMIEEKAEEVEAARKVEEEQLRRYRVRVRAMEENGGYDFLTLLLNVDSFSDLLAAVDDINQIMEADSRLEEDYIAARTAHEEVKAEYEATKAELVERQEELDREQKELEQMILEAVDLIASLDEDIEKWQKEYEEAERARAAADYRIGQLIAEINRQNAAIAAAQNPTPAPTETGSETPAATEAPAPAETGGETPAATEAPAPAETGGETPATTEAPAPAENGGETPTETEAPAPAETGGETPAATEAPAPAETGSETPAATEAPETGSGLASAGSAGVVGSGSLQWPVPSGHNVTSRFGMRIHPITGEERYHSGMDIDGFNNEGGAIVACDDGVVVTAEWYGNYGNCVIIDHGNGMQTLYAHMSGFAVSAGDTVSKGQTIGYLGSTGWATGTHCHLEIFIDGNRVDPAGYFSGINYVDC